MYDFIVLFSVSINEVRVHDLVSLREKFKSADIRNDVTKSYNKIMGEEDYIINDIVRKHGKGVGSADAFVRAGPRATMHLDPKKVKAAIVTCGGLCPGLNNVIREIVHALESLYDVKSVIGIR
jgi:6-phosphofructokinase 1